MAAVLTQAPAPATDSKPSVDADADVKDAAQEQDKAEEREEEVEEEEEEEEEVVAVGSVAHVVQRAFRSFFPPAPATRTETAASSESAATEESSPLAADAQQQEMSSAAPSTDPVDGAEAAASDSLAHQSAPSDDDAPLAPDPASNPFVLLGIERKRAIKAELRGERQSANRLLAFLEERHADARRAEDATEAQLRRQGLVMKEQIPLGPSPLRIDAHEVAAPAFGAFSSHLLHAKAIVADYHRQRLERSGNAPSATRPRADGALAGVEVGDGERTRGYLDSTHSAEIRTDATLALHKRRIAGVKTFHASSSFASCSLGPGPDGSLGAPAACEARSPTRQQSSSPTQQPRTSKRAEPVAMRAADKRANMAVLHRMQTKLDFLRNPRYADKADKADGSGDDPHSFSVDPPPPVGFTAYDIGGVYEQTLLVRNRSALSRRLRVLPPATLFFSIAEVVFPDPSGLVAPGMHVLVRLRFAPDSRADYRDVLTVQYESVADRGGGGGTFRELAVPLAAHREPPELSIPLVLRARNTLVGDASRTEIPCKNSGGAGMFWLMTEREWTRFEAETAFRGSDGDASGSSAASDSSAAALAASQLAASGGSIGTPGRLRLGPFRLSPTRLELRTGEVATLALDYTPSSVGEHRERIVMVCDNCLVRVFQLVGRGCQVELAVTGVNAAPIDRSIASMGALDTLFFPPDVLVDSSARQTVTVANDTPIDVPYSWTIAPSDRSQQVEEPPFRVEPACGVLPKSSSLEFAVVFSPTRPRRDARFTAALMARDVPACSLPGPKQAPLLAAAVKYNRQCQADGDSGQAPRCEPAVQALAIALSGGSRLGAFAIEPAVWNFAEQLHKDRVHVAHVTLRNESAAPVRFEWEPDAWRRRCRTSPSSPPPLTLSVSPTAGTLAANSCQRVAIELTPHCVGPFSVAIPCAIPCTDHRGGGDADSAFSRPLLLVGDVARAQVRVLSREVDFGLVLAGGSAEAAIEICNTSPSAVADWKFVHLVEAGDTPRPLPKSLPHSASKESVASRQSVATTAGNETDRSGVSSFATSRESAATAAVAFAPESGRLGPGEQLAVRAKCLAGALPERFRATLACHVAHERAFPPALADKAPISAAGSAADSIPALGGVVCRSPVLRASRSLAAAPPPGPATVCVSARAEIQSPRIFLSTTKLPLGATYLGVSVRRSVQLVNISNLEASFKFVEPEAAAGPKPYALELTPRTGTIRSKERLEVVITYTARTAGRCRALVACNVRGLPAPLGFELTSVHKGLVLAYELVESPAAATATATPLQPSASTESMASVPEGVESSSAAEVPATIPRLAFGDDVPLGERRTLHLLVRNLSGIDAVVDLEAKKFPAAATDGDSSDGLASTSPPPSSALSGSRSSRKARPGAGSHKSSRRGRVPTVERARKEATAGSSIDSSAKSAAATKSSRAALLSGSHEHMQRLQSGSGRAYALKCADALEDRRVLRRGRGVAFRPEPARVRIAPWGHAVVRVVCFNNKPGAFADEIVSRAAGLPPVLLPAVVTVTGAPLVLDRNCVGLFFPRPPAAAACYDQSKTKGRKLPSPPPSVPEYPTLRFGQVCVRSQAPVTRSLRVVNRSPQPARVTWRLTPPGHENHLVALALRVDFAARVQLRISPCAERSLRRRRSQSAEDDEDDGPFSVSPPVAVVAPFGAAPFRVTLRPSDAVAMHRLMLVADAKWLDNAADCPSVELLDDDSSGEDDGGEKELPASNQCSESPRTQPLPDRSAVRTAAGKAIAAVRVANTLARHSPTHSSGIGEPSGLSKSCVRVLLTADVIEPELFLDKGTHAGDCKDSFHVTFSTWSTIVGATTSSRAAAAMHAFHRRELQLVNHLQAPLTFRLECVGPFVVFRAESLAPRHPLSLADLPPAHRRAQGESFMFSLPPAMAVRLDLRFDPSLMEAPLAFGQPAAGANAAPRPLRSLVDGELRVRFANQSVQTVRLAAHVLQPMLAVSPSTHAFGRVRLTRQRAVTLRVANPTAVPAQFAVEHVPLPAPLSRAHKHEFARHHAQFVDEPAVFSFSITSGVLHGPTLPLRSAGGLLPSAAARANDGVHAPLAIDVSFRPRDAGTHYRSRFRLAVALGHAFEVELHGVGHLDEHETDDQERPVVRAPELVHRHRIFTRL